MSTHSAGDAIDLPFVLALSFAQLISWGSVFYGFSLFISPLEAALGLSRASSSLAFSLALLMEGLAAYAVGRWIDRGHAQWVMCGGSLLLGLAFIAHTQVHLAWQFYAVWALLGVGMAATLYTPAFAVLTQRFAQHYRRAIIILTFLGGLASTVFIPLIAWLIQTWGWRNALWVLGLTHLLLCAPLHHRLLRPQNNTRADPAPGAEAAPAKPHPRQYSASRQSLRAHLQDRNFWLIALFMVLLMAVTTAVPAHILPLLHEARLPDAWVLTVAAAIGVMQVLGRLVLFVLDQRLNVHATNRWVPGLIPLGLLLLWLGSGPLAGLAWTSGPLLGAALFVLCYGMGNGMLTIVKGTVVAQYVSQAHVGRLNGVINLPMALARAAAPWLLGLLWQPQGGYGTGLWVLTALSCIGVSALWWAQARVLAQQASER